MPRRRSAAARARYAAEQRRFIEEHGGSRAGYDLTYRRLGRADGTAIYDADIERLRRIELGEARTRLLGRTASRAARRRGAR